jgi:hypothetical protein
MHGELKVKINMNIYFTARHNKLTIAYHSCTVYFMKTLQKEAKKWQAEKTAR